MRAVDLFCGCGGMSLGFKQAGIDIVAGFENWSYAVECYRKNFHHPVIEIDLSDTENAIQIIQTYNPDLIIGGPPCQDFSTAGKRKEGNRADLTLAYAQIVAAISPAYFVMENVERVSHSKAYQHARELLKEKGYGLTERVLNACFFGVPQNRKRFFCIGIKGAPDGAIDSLLSCNQSVLPLTIREYYRQNNLELPFEHYYRHPRTYKRRGIFSVDEPAPTIRGVNRPRPAQYQMNANDIIDPANVRAMTPKERAIVQTFPDQYEWPDVPMRIIEQMIGNAVPVKLARHVGESILAYSEGRTDEKDIRFADWLMEEKKYSIRAVSDVLSRIKRANRIVMIENHTLSETMQALQESGEFANINKTVQSQMKRALRLYHEYGERGGDKE